jgi:hypothetical protein
LFIVASAAPHRGNGPTTHQFRALFRFVGEPKWETIDKSRSAIALARSRQMPA